MDSILQQERWLVHMISLQLVDQYVEMESVRQEKYVICELMVVQFQQVSHTQEDTVMVQLLNMHVTLDQL